MAPVFIGAEWITVSASLNNCQFFYPGAFARNLDVMKSVTLNRWNDHFLSADLLGFSTVSSASFCIMIRSDFQWAATRLTSKWDRGRALRWRHSATICCKHSGQGDVAISVSDHHGTVTVFFSVFNESSESSLRDYPRVFQLCSLSLPSATCSLWSSARHSSFSQYGM